MASRMKEDERNEKIIRGLLKLPANRRCINCNNLGPQYVCTNFWTFICTNCSGLHREFCHRVKSISMAKFTAQEVNALQEGGNEKARQVYFKEWDPQRNSLPDSSNIDRLRDFIKHVYVDRRFTGEKNIGRPLGGKEDTNDSRDSGRGDSYRGGSRSPPYDDRYSERVSTGGRNGDRNFRDAYGERSPGYDQSDNKRSPRQFEAVDDRVRDDRFGNGNQFRRFEERRLPDVLTKKPEGSSPSRQKDVSSPPLVRPVRDILGDDAPKLHVGDPPKSNSSRVPDNSAQTQRTLSSSSMGSSDGNSVQLKKVNLGSLIDFNADPEPPVSSPPQHPVSQQTTSPPSNGGDWASFDTVGQQKPPQAASGGSIESTLSQLSMPGPVPNTNGGQWPTTQQLQTSLFPANQNIPNPSFNTPVVGAQSWGSSTVPSAQGPLPNSTGHSSQLPSKQPLESSQVVSSLSMEAKPTGRKELPADLFTAFYSSRPVAVPGWQRGPHPGYGYGMQYPTGMVHPQAMPAYPPFTQPSKSANPFDVGGEPTLTHVSTFPSMGSLQGALPNVPGPSPSERRSSLGNPSPQWAPSQQSSYPQAMAQGQYMGHQVPSNMPQLPHSNMVMMGHQGTGSLGSSGSGYGNMGMDPSSTGRYSLPSTPNSFSSPGGNPFG